QDPSLAVRNTLAELLRVAFARGHHSVEAVARGRDRPPARRLYLAKMRGEAVGYPGLSGRDTGAVELEIRGARALPVGFVQLVEIPLGLGGDGDARCNQGEYRR